VPFGADRPFDVYIQDPAGGKGEDVDRWVALTVVRKKSCKSSSDSRRPLVGRVANLDNGATAQYRRPRLGPENDGLGI
jgi:hypothetical protein